MTVISSIESADASPPKPQATPPLPTAQTASPRNPLWDIVRGLGMVFVVAGHGFGGDIERFVNMFHIPLFFFVSGLVFKFVGRSFLDALVFLRKSLKSLWWPSLRYGVFFVLTHNLFAHWGLYHVPRYGLAETAMALARHVAFFKTERLEGAMWFLTALFVGRCLLYAVTWLSSGVSDNAPRIRLAVELSLVGCFFAIGCTAFYIRLDIPGNADAACSLLPFLYAGFKLKRTDLARPWLLGASLAVLVLLFVFDNRSIHMNRNNIVSPVFLLLSSTSGIVTTCGLATMLVHSPFLAKAVALVGRHTIPILCLHFLAFRAVSWLWMTVDGLSPVVLANHPIVAASFFWGALYTTAGILLPLIIPALEALASKSKKAPV